MTSNNALPPIHPGEIIREDILPSAEMSVTSAAKALGVSARKLREILSERRPLSASLCIKISKLFGSTPDHWMRLQASYDLKVAEQDRDLQMFLATMEPIRIPEDAHR